MTVSPQSKEATLAGQGGVANLVGVLESFYPALAAKSAFWMKAQAIALSEVP